MHRAIRCRYASLVELPAGREAAREVLSAVEYDYWRALGSVQRRRTWLAGRALAKRLVSEWLGEKSFGEIDIDSHSADGRSGVRPRMLVGGEVIDGALSIAHTARGVLVALSVDANLTPGVDLVSWDDVRPAALEWCLSPAERRWLADSDPAQHAAAQLWARKEAIYKACQSGEGFAPQRIEGVPGQPPRYPGSDRRRVHDLQCWRVDGQWAALAVADRADMDQDAMEIFPRREAAADTHELEGLRARTR